MKKFKFNKTSARFFRDFVENYFQGQGMQVTYWPMTFHIDDPFYFQPARTCDKAFAFYYYSNIGIIDLYVTEIDPYSDGDYEYIVIRGYRNKCHSWKVNEKAYDEPANCGTVEPQSNCETI